MHHDFDFNDRFKLLRKLKFDTILNWANPSYYHETR